MGFLEKVKPEFWKSEPHYPGTTPHLFNFRRIWKLSVLLTGIVALVPLIFITFVDYQVTERSLESEFRLRTARNVSNTRRAIGFFLTERRSALEFIVRDNAPEALNNPLRLSAILDSLQKSFGGGFMDLGVIDATGEQTTYVGAFGLQYKDYNNQTWFQQVVDQGIYISDVFLGYRNVPHLVIAVKQSLAEGSFHVLRASIGIGPFENLLSNLELGGSGDAFIINRHGILQTNSRNHGKVLDRISLPMPKNHAATEVIEGRDQQGTPLLMGYRFIENTPFILMIVINKNDLMKSWRRTRLGLILFLVISITVIMAVILGTASYMVHNMHLADEKRLMSLHQVEYENKMASIGRMAASVAHEINNPLAIINEKAGLIKDLFTLKKQYAPDAKLIGLIDAIIASVMRAGKITKRLLTFSRHMDATIERLEPGAVVRDVISFVEKEAEHRAVSIKITVPPDTPAIESDRGKLQQIFLNIVNNALAAITDGGHLDIDITSNRHGWVTIQFKDDGCGIADEDMQRIFEPFFSTKTSQGGTGLGLSITYNLIQEIGGKLNVTSELGKGTCFSLDLPQIAVQDKERNDARIVG